MTRSTIIAVAVLIGSSNATFARPHKVFSVDKVTLHILKCKPPKLQVIAYGHVTSAGWKNPQLVPYIYVKPPADGLQGFDFIAEKPSGVSIPVLTPIMASCVIDLPNWLKGVRVSASTNSVEALLKEARTIDCSKRSFERSVAEYTAKKGVSVTISLERKGNCVTIKVKVKKGGISKSLDLGEICVDGPCVEFSKKQGIAKVEGRACLEGKEICVYVKGCLKIAGSWQCSGEYKKCVGP